VTLAVVAATWKELAAGLAPLGFGPAPAPDLGPDARPGLVVERTMAGQSILACATGVGLINAALGLGSLMALHRPTGVLNIGVAGSYDLAALPLGAACVARREVWPEYGLEAGGLADARALKFPVHPGPGAEVWQSLDLDPEDAAGRLGLALPPDPGPNPPTGQPSGRSMGLPRVVSASVSTVTTTAGTAGRLRGRLGADIENMEGFALALGCLRAGVDFLELRTVSNRVGSRERADWDLAAALEALGRACLCIFGLSGREKKV
jgi:futalosine hydrolase